MGVVESTIARHIVRVRYEDLPRQVVEATKEKVLDTIGVMIAGSGAPGSDIVASQLAEWGGKGESNVVVTGRRLPAPHAAQIHGGWAHADEFCDSDDRQTCKPSATVVPVALALAEARGATGKDLILAIALGVDLACRIGMALRPQPASIGRDEGVFSGAAAGAKVLGLDEEGVLNALGIGYTQLAPAGMSTQSPSLTKRLIPGQDGGCLGRRPGGSGVRVGQGDASREPGVLSHIPSRGGGPGRAYPGSGHALRSGALPQAISQWPVHSPAHRRRPGTSKGTSARPRGNREDHRGHEQALHHGRRRRSGRRGPGLEAGPQGGRGCSDQYPL